MRLQDTINPYQPNKAVQTQTKYTSKHTSRARVSRRAERKIHFMNIGFHYEGEKQLCCGSFFNDPKSTCMNLLVVAVCLIWGNGIREKKGKGEPVPQWVLTDHETRLGLSTQIMDPDNLLDRQVILLQTGQAGIQFSDTLVAVCLMVTCKGETTDFSSRFNVCVKSLGMIYFLDARGQAYFFVCGLFSM